MKVPESAFKELFYRGGEKTILHLEKKLAYKPWTALKVIVEAQDMEAPTGQKNNQGNNGGEQQASYFSIDTANPQSYDVPSAGVCLKCM